MGGVSEDVMPDHEVYCISARCFNNRRDYSGKSIGIRRGISYTLTTRDRNAVLAPVTAADPSLLPGIPGKTPRMEDLPIGYCVRRLTPLECERLQGFPDRWTESGQEGQRFSDERRYRMLGNSIAIPCVTYIMRGIKQALAGSVG